MSGASRIVARLRTKLKARIFFLHFVVVDLKWNLTGKVLVYQALKKNGALKHRMSSACRPSLSLHKRKGLFTEIEE